MHSTSLLLPVCVLVHFYLADGFRSLFLCEDDSEEPWSYFGQENGPDKWNQTYPNCSGSNQSPIDIKTKEAVLDVNAGKLFFKNYDKSIKNAMVVNNGHTVQITAPMDVVARTIEVGESVYTFYQLHFHWGAFGIFTDFLGSEHTLDGQRYTMEAHFVHTNKENAIAVVAVFFELSNDARSEFDQISGILENVTYKYDYTVFDSDLILEKLLPENPSDYYHYNGSLTTPGCNEGVAWFILKKTMVIARAELTALQNLFSTTEKKYESGAFKYSACVLGDNYRPTQPLFQRTVIKTSN